MGNTFKKKSIYHSELVKVTPTTIKFNDPMDSKFKEGERISAMEIEGDDETYFYLIENQECEDTISAIAGMWTTVEANGREESARIVAAGRANVDDSDAPSPPSNNSGNSNPGNDKYGPRSVLEQYQEVIDVVANEFGDPFDEDGFLSEGANRMVVALHSSWNRTNRYSPLYPGQVRESELYEEDVEVEEDVGEPDNSALAYALGEYIEGESKLTWKGESHDGIDLKAMRKRLKSLTDEEDADDDVLQKALSWCNEESRYQDEVVEGEEEEEDDDDDLPF